MHPPPPAGHPLLKCFYTTTRLRKYVKYPVSNFRQHSQSGSGDLSGVYACTFHLFGFFCRHLFPPVPHSWKIRPQHRNSWSPNSEWLALHKPALHTRLCSQQPSLDRNMLSWCIKRILHACHSYQHESHHSIRNMQNKRLKSVTPPNETASMIQTSLYTQLLLKYHTQLLLITNSLKITHYASPLKWL